MVNKVYELADKILQVTNGAIKILWWDESTQFYLKLSKILLWFWSEMIKPVIGSIWTRVGLSNSGFIGMKQLT